MGARDGLMPLSREQEGVWLATRLSETGADYNNILLLRMQGALDLPALERCLSIVAARHEILRTIYVEVEGTPRQRVLPATPVRIARESPPEEVRVGGWDSAALDAFARACAARPFDLAHEWPWRGSIVPLAELDHVLVLVMHHIATDAAAAAQLLDEIGALYLAPDVTGASLPEPTIQYGDYAAWQRAGTEDAGPSLAYWTAHLAARPERLALPRRATPAAKGGDQRDRVRFSLGPEVTLPLQATAQASGATAFTALLAGFAVVLGRIGGDRDILVDVPVSLRRRPELQGLHGLLVNDLVVRADLDAAPTFRALLEQVRCDVRAAFAHALPFDELVRALNPDRSAGRRLCQVSLNYQKYPARPPVMRGLETALRRLAAFGSRHDLVLEVASVDDVLACQIEFDATSLDRSTIEQVAEGLAVLLRAAAEHPGAPIDELPTLAPATVAARSRTLSSGLATTAGETTVPALFAERVRCTPAHLAIRDETGSLTVAELDERSNRLAHLLMAHGAGAGARVGLCLPRSVDLVVAALAALKAGAAYVPLDPVHPPKRLRQIGELSQLSSVVTIRATAGGVAWGAVPVLVLEEQQAPLAGQPAEAPDVPVTPDSPAYVLFTSGTTGRPRGVVGLHRGVANRIAWMRRAYPFEAGEVCVQKTPTSFVDSVWEIFGPLVCGVPLIVLPDAVVRDARALVERLAGEAVTRVVLVPSLLEAILDLPLDLAATLPALRVSVSSGEALSPTLARRCLERLPGVTLLNIYGTSEVSADVACAELRADEIGGRVPVGKPIDNVAIYLLDRAGQIVAPGQAGEVFVAGAALAAGYLGDPDATAERFVPDPFAGTPGTRMFRTGDIGRFRPDGDLEIVGRVDHQIKLLGRRIDPGEIEDALARHPAIRQAVVVCQQAETRRPRLAAFVVLRSGAPAPPPGELRSLLLRALPDYMVPAVFVTLPEFPLSPHAKVDRRRLATLEPASHDEGGRESPPPTTPLETALAVMWGEVLGTAPQSVDDDFFEAGGHSLLATGLLWRIRERLGIDTSPRTLFEHPTVRTLAAALGRMGDDARQVLPPIVAVSRRDPIPASPAQRRFWLDEHLQPARGAHHLSGAYLLRGDLDAGVLDRCLTELLRRHEGLRTAWEDVDGHLLLRIHPAPAHATPVEDLTAVPADAQPEVVGNRLRAEHVRPFDLQTEPPFRARLYRLTPDRHVLGIVVHHGAIDGWSAGIVLTELGALYRSLSQSGTPPPLPPPLGYADFSAWQHARLAAGDFDAQRDYWRRQLAGAPAALDLHVDRPPAARISHAAARCPVAIDAALVSRLRSIGQGQGATLFMTLCAAYAVLLARHTGQWELVVGTVAANRRLPSTASMVGAFMNTLALRFELDANAGFALALRQARELATAAFDNQDIPFDVVVSDVGPRQRGGQGPLFETFFVLQDRSNWHLDLGAIDVTEIDVVAGTTPMPLSLVLHEAEGGVRGYFEYSRDLFDARTIERLGANLGVLLGAIATSPDAAIGSLAAVAEDELERLRRFECPQPGPPPAGRVARLDARLAQQVARTPDAPAAASGGREHSYRAVDRRARQVAGRLRALGVGPGEVVAISVSRSVSLLVAVLGAVQAGCAFVVIPPEYPDQRRRFIVEDSGAVALVTGATSPAEPGADDGLVLTRVREGAGGPAAEPLEDGSELACLVYTSGSTGQPKGVRLSHRNIAAMADAWRAAFGITAASRVAQMVSPAFDVALADIFATLSAGACVCLLTPAETLPGPALVRALADLGVTHWALPPSVLAECPLAPLPELSTVIVGGETCGPDVLRRWAAGRRLYLSYGLTEGTVLATAEPFEPGRPPTIGRPVAGAHVAVLDPRGARVPIGVPGEITLGGPMVSEGYHRQPELTARRFVPAAGSGNPGTHRLRTGDRARWHADGRLEFLGRIDRQLKYHGLRIEPGEIEAAATSHAAVEQAVVLVREDARGEPTLVAYVVARRGGVVSADSLRAHLRARLPATMCPTDVVFLDAYPRTPTGKIDTAALPAPERGFAAPGPIAGATGRAEAAIAAAWRDVLGHDRFGPDDNFFDAGGHSLAAVRVHDRLRRQFGDTLTIVDLFEHPTVRSLARHLDGSAPAARVETRRDAVDASQAIAIIGMACRYPGARSAAELWQNLVDGVEGLRTLSPDEMRAAGVDDAAQADPRRVPVGGVLDDVDRFDADLFGCSPVDARVMDPQQRALLELSRTALDVAGYDPARYPGRIGVFAGVGFNTYLHSVLFPGGTVPADATGFAAIASNDKDFAASQVAYRLDLRGPAITVQSACSTSLVAVDMASQALLSGRCDMALAGGVSIRLPQHTGYVHEDGMILSPDGHCRPFDAAANGTVGSNGGGVVLLKRLEAALADDDVIEAVILGSASNNDGAGKVGFAAPGVEGQARVIRAALERAGVDPASVQYVESHGTGTGLGDPIEVRALNEAYAGGPAARTALGAIKGNIGHTDAGAGVAGLIKTALALKHGRIPRTLHFTSPNPRIDFASGPFFVPAETLPWPEGPRRAAVSAFGIGGTNAHVVLEAAPARAPVETPAAPDARLLPVSGRDEAALRQGCADLAAWLAAGGPALDDVAFTLQEGRSVHPHRHVVVCDTVEAARAALDARARGVAAWPAAGSGRTAWMFSGQGSQYAGMGRALYAQDDTFRRWIDTCAGLARRHLGSDIRDLVCSGPPGGPASTHVVHPTRIVQPALLAVEYALARMWQARGVTPSAMVGHSLGEYTAACLADVFTLEDALAIVCERGRLMETCAPGAMLAIAAGGAEVLGLLAGGPPTLELAAVNGPSSCVVSGPVDAIEQLRRQLGKQRHAARRLATDRAFHSAMMDPIAEDFAAVIARVPRAAPRIPIVSTMTGTWLTDEQAVDPEYWRQQLRRTVRFGEAILTLDAREPLTLLELGPGDTLAAMARQARGGDTPSIVTSLPRMAAAAEADRHVTHATGRLWGAGVSVRWEAVRPHAGGRRVALPPYPFQRQSYWGLCDGGTMRAAAAPRRGRRPIEEWFYTPSWRRRALPETPRPPRGGTTWLVFSHGGPVEADLVGRLRADGAEVVEVLAAPKAAQTGERRFSVSPGRLEDHQWLGRTLEARGLEPTHVVHLWGLSAIDRVANRCREIDRQLELGVHSLLACARALAESRPAAGIVFAAVTCDALDVTGAETLDPTHSPSIGAIKVIPLEYTNLRCRHIDLAGGTPAPGAAGHILAELDAEVTEPSVAYRGSRRWVPGLEPMTAAPPASPGAFRRDAAYLITGGLGGVGLTLARFLATSVGATVGLVGRTGVPPRDAWDTLLAGDDTASAPLRARVARLKAIEEAGGRVYVYRADVADTEAMRRAVADLRARGGPIAGCVHAAGVADHAGVIHRRDRASTDAALTAKIQGTLVLHDVLRDEPLDFMVLCSTLGSCLHEAKFGQVGYAAASEFLDAWAPYARRLGVPAIAVNWDDWAEVGMSVDAARLCTASDAGRGARAALTPGEGLEVFRRLAASRESRVVTSIEPIDEARRHVVATFAGTLLDAPPDAHGSDPADLLPRLWQEALGVTDVAADGDFFMLGGHSLMAIQLLGRIEAAFGLRLPLAGFLEQPTLGHQIREVERALARALAVAPPDATGTGASEPQDEWEL